MGYSTLFFLSFLLLDKPVEVNALSTLLISEESLGDLVDIRDWAALDDQIFVASMTTGSLGKVDLSSLRVEMLAGKGPGPGEFSRPSGIHATKNFLFVVDSDQKKIVKLRHDGKFVATVKAPYEGGDITIWKEWIVVTNDLRPYSKPQYLLSTFHLETNERRNFLPLGEKFFKARPKFEDLAGLANLSAFSDVTASDGHVFYASICYLSNYFKINLNSGDVEEFPLYAKAPMPLVFGLENLEELPVEIQSYNSMLSVQADKSGKVHVLSGNTWKDGELVKGRTIKVISGDGQLLKKIHLDRSFKLLLHLENRDYYLGLDDEDQLIYKITVK